MDVKERPILFSAPMVRAILDGRKTQTRRAIKPQPERCDRTGFVYTDKRGTRWASGLGFDENATRKNFAYRCPYGRPGERLWVRETFQPLFAEGFEHGDERIDWKTGAGYQVRYTATEPAVEWVDADDEVTSRCKPAIHMPRWASRILLEVTGVRVERLQDISNADAVSEGMSVATQLPCGAFDRDPVEDFSDLWDSINGPGSWDANLWVWAIEFRRVDAQQVAA